MPSNPNDSVVHSLPGGTPSAEDEPHVRVIASRSRGATFCSVMLSPADDITNINPLAQISTKEPPPKSALLRRVPVFVHWTRMTSTGSPQKTSSEPNPLLDKRVHLCPPPLSEVSQHALIDLSNATPTLSTMKH